MNISVDLYLQGQQIGSGKLRRTDSVPDFTSIEIQIYYNDSIQFPDIAKIFIECARKPAKEPSRLVVDKLSFDGFTTGLDENSFTGRGEGNGLLIYPNPTRNHLIIEVENNVKVGDYLQLFSLNGQLIKELQLIPNQNRIDLNLTELEAGFYFINVFTGTFISKGKVVVIK